MKKVVRCIVLFLVFCLLFGLSLIVREARPALDIVVTGSWTETVDASDLLAGAGSEIAPIYSTTDQIKVDLATGKNDYWSVSVKKVDSNWHSGAQLSVQRTNDGTGDGWISGGTSWLGVTDSDQEFFTGYKKIKDIFLQYKLDISLQVSPDTYTTTVYYTIVKTS